MTPDNAAWPSFGLHLLCLQADHFWGKDGPEDPMALHVDADPVRTPRPGVMLCPPEWAGSDPFGRSA